MDLNYLKGAAVWFPVSFLVAAVGVYFADSKHFVTDAWHVYFIAQSRGVLTTDSDVTWSEIYRLIMATIGSFLCILCFVNRFTKSPRENIVTSSPKAWERVEIAAFALIILLVTLVALPSNLHVQVLKQLGLLTTDASLSAEVSAMRETLPRVFQGGAIIVKGQPAFQPASQVFSGKVNPDKIANVAIWRNPKTPTEDILIANEYISGAEADATRPEDQVRFTVNVSSKTKAASIAEGALGPQGSRSYFSEIWRPYLMPYSLYSIGLWLFIIFPVIFFLIRSGREDWFRFHAGDLSRPTLPVSASATTLTDYQRGVEHRLSAIKDVISRYLAVCFVVWAIATVEFGFSYIRASATPQAATFGKWDLIVIWLSCLVIAVGMIAFYFNEYGYATRGFESLEDIAAPDLYQTVRTGKNSFSEQYSSLKWAIRGGVAAALISISLFVVQKYGTRWTVPFICGALPPGAADQLIRSGHASGLTPFPDCAHYVNSTKQS